MATASKRDIFIEALQKESATERAAYLQAACGDDQELRQQVEELLALHEKDSSFILDKPPDVSLTVNMPPLTEKPGTQIGPYKLLQQIGEGGMGVVYMAEQTEPVKRRVAFKIIKPGMDTRQVIARFEAERQALAVMDHPHIARVFDAGTTESGRPYFVMELVNGIPITRYCDEQHLTPRERLELFVPVCQAVQHAHQKGIIHRDLKPSNILVALYDQKPVPKVIDFGVAKATSQSLTEKTLFTELGQIVGTLEYMSPEQAQRNQLDIDTRSDVYSLGVVLYELLTGTTPLERKRLRSAGYDEILRLIREEETPRPSLRLSSIQTLPSIAANRRTEPVRLQKLLRGELDWIVLKALEKDRKRRYDTANGFAADIQRYLDDEAVVACPPSAAYRFRKFTRRNKAVLSTAALLALALLLGLIGTSLGMWRASREARRAIAAERETGLERDRARNAEQSERQKSRVLEKQLHIATATRLAAQSQLVREEPTKSTLLAIEAVEATRRYGEPIVPVAYETLLKSAAVLGGQPLRHQGFVHTAAISPNSRWLITGGGDVVTKLGEARLWDLAAENPTASPILLPGHDRYVMIVAINNRWAVTSPNDKTVRLWNLKAENPAKQHVDLPHEGAFMRVAISEDGSWLATQGDLGVKLWDLTAEDPRSSPIEFRDEGQPAFSHDGHWLLTTIQPRPGAPTQTRLRKLRDDNRRWSRIDLADHQDDLRNAEFSPGGQWLAMRGKQAVHLWNLTSSAEDSLPKAPVLDVGERILSLAFTPDAQQLIVGCDTGVQLWDVARDTPPNLFAKLPTGDHGRVKQTISRNGWLAAECNDNTVALWNLTANDPVSSRRLLRGHTDGVFHLAISLDNRWLVTASSDGTARVWSLTAEKPEVSPIVLQGHDRNPRRTMISPDSRWLVTVSGGTLRSSARLWRLDPHPISSPLELAAHPAKMTYHYYSWDSRWVVAGTDDGSVRVWDLHSDNPATSARVFREHHASVRHLTMSPDCRWLVTASDDRTAVVWRFRDGDPKMEYTLPHVSEVRYVLISPDSRWVLTETDEADYLWDLTASDPESFEKELPPISSGGNVHPWKWLFSPNSRWLITLRPEGQVRDLTSPDLEVVFPFPTKSLSDSAVAISGDSRWLASASDEGETVRVWDLKSDDPAASELKLLGHKETVRGVAFSPKDHHLLFTMSDDRTVRRWDLRAENSAASSFVRHGGLVNVTMCAVSPNGRWLATAGAFTTPSQVRLWDLAETNSSAIMLAGRQAVLFSSDSQRLWTLSHDRTQRLWDLRADDPAKSSRSVPTDLYIETTTNRRWVTGGMTTNGRWVSSMSADRVRMWDFQVDSQLSRARYLAGRELTQDEREQYELLTQ